MDDPPIKKLERFLERFLLTARHVKYKFLFMYGIFIHHLNSGLHFGSLTLYLADSLFLP